MGYCLPYRNGSAGCAPWLSTGLRERRSGASQDEEGAVDLDIHTSYPDPLPMTNRNPFIFAPFHNDGGPSRGCAAEGDPGVEERSRVRRGPGGLSHTLPNPLPPLRAPLPQDRRGMYSAEPQTNDQENHNQL